MRTRIIIAFLVVTGFAMAVKKAKTENFSVENYGVKNSGTLLQIKFQKGPEHNHPLFAIWLADADGKYIQTLYASESIGRGYFKHSSRTAGKWLPGEIQRPAALPYWIFQRNEKNEKGGLLPTVLNPVVDAYTGATPQVSFFLNVKTEKPLNGSYKIMFELNQSWDWNEAWYNARFQGEKEYQTSSQPALVYSADIQSTKTGVEIPLKPIGHSHYSGKDGSLTKDLSTITTALKIAKSITVKVQ
ncbi:MAG: hypothetical protein ACOYM7_01040 [Paludibacter sp.]